MLPEATCIVEHFVALVPWLCFVFFKVITQQNMMGLKVFVSLQKMYLMLSLLASQISLWLTNTQVHPIIFYSCMKHSWKFYCQKSLYIFLTSGHNKL